MALLTIPKTRLTGEEGNRTIVSVTMDPIEYSLYLCEENLMAEKPVNLKQAFDAILDLAARADVRIVLVGGLARNAYLRPRFTDDIDFLLRDQATMDRVSSMAEGEFHVPKDVEGLAALRHRSTGVEVDLMVAEYPFEVEGFDAASPRKVRRREVQVMPIEHLCAMKVDAAGSPNRYHDFGDVTHMLVEGGADEAIVSALVLRDLPKRAETLDAILRVVLKARAAPPATPKGRRTR